MYLWTFRCLRWRGESEFSTTNTNATQAASTDRLNYFISEQTGTPVLALTGSGTVLEAHRGLPYLESRIGIPQRPEVHQL